MTHTAARIAVVVISISGLGTAVASAQAPAARPVIVKSATGQLGASINSAGLQQSFDLSASRSLTASANPWFAGIHAALGGSVAATPAGARAGAWAEIAPLSVWVVRAGVEPGQYFGTFHSLTSFDSRLDAFDPDARKARNAASSGRTIKRYVTNTLQLQSGHFAARTTFSAERWTSSAAGPFFYEPTRDTLLDVRGDHVASMTSVVAYQRALAGGGQLMVGPMHSITRVSKGDLNRIQKVGVFAVQQMGRNHFGLIRPNLSVQAAYYIDDPSKKSQWSGAVAIGFSLARRH